MMFCSYRYMYSDNSTSPAAAAAITLSNTGHDNRSDGVDNYKKKTTAQWLKRVILRECASPVELSPTKATASQWLAGTSGRNRRRWSWGSSRPSGFGKAAGRAERVGTPQPSKSWGRSSGPLVSFGWRGRGVSKETRIQADVIQCGRGCSNTKWNTFVSHSLSVCVSIVPILP